MASIGTTFTIEWERRLCKVENEFGYFHCWEHYADVISPGLTIGSHPGGQFSRVYGIVEFKDRVERVEPYKIKFVDAENAELAIWDKSNKKEDESL